MNETVFLVGLIVHTFLFAMFALSYMSSGRFQFWPPPSKKSWQYHLLWWSLRLLIVCIAGVIYWDNSSLYCPAWLRFYLAIPTFIVTFVLGTIAASQLGWRNTHGEAVQFVASGVYKYSRNPQYVFYAVSFLFLGIWAASLYALILLSILSLWYLLAPFSEEQWLEKQYGEIYTTYKNRVPRYLGRRKQSQLS